MLISINAKHLSHRSLNQTVKFVENKIQSTILGSTVCRNQYSNTETGEWDIMEA